MGATASVVGPTAAGIAHTAPGGSRFNRAWPIEQRRRGGVADGGPGATMFPLEFLQSHVGCCASGDALLIWREAGAVHAWCQPCNQMLTMPASQPLMQWAE